MKLKKLILAGFKSFADRTEFDFADGVSCIVGPNGCGKSNVVDAFKWVLGSQSPKSLRGTEMSDVIFNGCSTRRPAGMAEVSLVFDNADGMLSFEVGGEGRTTDEVAVTRRLYRDGNSEYLINKRSVRLRDLREMFMDTGVGVDAYSLIEQGRVEVFLQASQEDRRNIFDEAAGISKYKARKKEALRKLERVEQNLLRLTDILAEVEKRLRSIKVQAGKARNYQEHSERLKTLRSLHFLAQYHTLSQQRTALERQVHAATDTLSAIHAQIDRLESARAATEVEAVDQERAERELRGQIASVAGQITSREERIEMLRARIEELGDRIVESSRRAEELEAKVETVQRDAAAREGELQGLDEQIQQLASARDGARDEHAASQQVVAQLNDRLEDEKTGTIDLLRRTSQLHNEIHSHKVRGESLHGQRQRLTGRSAEVASMLERMAAEHGQLSAKLSDVRAVLADATQRLEDNRAQRTAASADEHRLQDELHSRREKRSAAQSRMQALREMQQRREGVADGVRRVLNPKNGPRIECIRGMLGDFVETDLEHARLVEAALAGIDQALVVDRLQDLQAAGEALNKLLGNGGAVEVFCLDRLGPLCEDFDPAQHPVLLHRLADAARVPAFLAPLMWRLLGRTFAIASLSDAPLAARLAPRGSRFVTPEGDVVEPDGRVRLHAAQKAAGIITRRSELSELQATVDVLNAEIADREQRMKSCRDEIRHLDDLQQKFRTAIYEANTERVSTETRLEQLHGRMEGLRREQPVIAADLQKIAADIESAAQAEHAARTKAQELEQLSVERQRETERLTAEIAQHRRKQDELAARLSDAKVALAQTEQKRVSLRDAAASLRRQAEQMLRDRETARSEVELNRQRRTDAETALTTAREEIEQLFIEQQRLEADAAEIEETRRGLQEKLEQIRGQLNEKRTAQDAAGGGLNASKLQLGETEVRVESLIARAADEMNMDLNALYPEYQHDEERDWAAVESEIADLRGKIERLGNVNLDAIAEQDELEKRRTFLAEQLEDIRNSQNQLSDLIRRINRESKEKFVATFDAVRANFQELFRKLFGGGRADVYLLDPEDVLESGIEVVARPPGKETRSISLLSGGEKTMTALALLFSIFRSRPSPVCLLDEVDAALDEANNQRFNRLIQEFVGTSQFLVITHAKRTMSMGSVLYGVTMQEPGVSKRISVRFEDSGENLDRELEPVEA